MTQFEFVEWLDGNHLTQQDFLSDPEICTREVLQQILEATRKWVDSGYLGMSSGVYSIPNVRAALPNEVLLRDLCSEQPEIKFSDVLSCWSGKLNVDFLLICFRQKAPSNSFSLELLLNIIHLLLEEKK